jgi:hypothetical protein
MEVVMRSSTVVIGIVLLSFSAYSPLRAACPAKPNKPCISPLPVPKPRSGPITIPTLDKFATVAEYRAALADYRQRSDRDFQAGYISTRTRQAEVRAIETALDSTKGMK